MVVLAFLCAPPPAQAATALGDFIASLETSERFDPEKLAAVYRETVLSGDGIDRAVVRLQAYARGVTLSREGQADCHLAIAHLQWRDGAIEEAVVSSEKALESSPTPQALLLKARLLDAGGQEDLSRKWYLRASEAFGEGEEQWLIRVRLAMMDVSGRNVEALEELAWGRDQDFRNQAAVVLALLGRPERAITLYQPLPEAGKLFRQHVRLSEWALQAESYDLAREQAWLGYAAAPVRADRLYALSLLTESYRSADELDRFLEDLASRDPEDQDLLRLRVETLIETEEYHRAIELYEQMEGSEANIAERRRLVALYEAAGDTDAMVREYLRMMDTEPGQVQWYDGLAAHYLNLADNDAALTVWEMLEERNAESAGILVEGGRLMLEMGLVDESVAMVERHLQTHGPDVVALLFLFGTWLNRGQDEPALNALVRLEEFLPADAAELVDLADAYERLSRPEEAIRVFEAIRGTRGELGYDQQLRLAWLYTVVNRKQEALNLWRDIWVSVESPARRSIAESQLLQLAAESSALGDMAVELEGMLIEGTANRNHMNLLVRLYTESGDMLSATGIIDEYAKEMGEDEVGHQALLAQVYLVLRNYRAYDKALRRLYEIDPVNRIDHIKSIILNLLIFRVTTESNERFDEIQHWIAELRKFEGETVTGEFEASIYSMAGLADQAVQAYRRALVEQSENSDNLLLLADVLDNNGRTDEAIAILQFFAENAVEDNEFVVAVDGILNLIGATTFDIQPDPEEVQGTLDWTKRVILERIAGRANKFYLYELLADIAREKGDNEALFVALENSLAEAGLRRPAVLRELLTMATPYAGFGGFSTGVGDIDRQLKHGRRLVGLRQQLPPEVYIDIGKSLLAREDVAGAKRAFEMIDDITGMIDIDLTKAENFEQAGYDEQSRVFYNRALNVNRDSLELLHKTGLLYEVGGREDVAFRRYLEAIVGLLRRQSTALASGAPTNQRTDTTVSREFREYYASLKQGLLLSWPEESEESAAAAAELKALLEFELRNVLDRSAEELFPLARYARLDRTARLIRQVGFFLDDQELAQYVDRKLLEHFGSDQAFAKHLVQAYGVAGRPLPTGVSVGASVSALAALSPLRRQLKLAETRNHFGTQLQLLKLAGAHDEMELLLGERILDGKFTEGLSYGRAFLGKAAFKRLAAVAGSKLAEDQGRLPAFLGSNGDLFQSAEALAGQPLVPPEQVITLLLRPETWKHVPVRDRSGHWQYLAARLSTDDRWEYFKELRRHSHALYSQLLQADLSPAQRTEIADRSIESLADLNGNYGHGVKRNVQIRLILNARPENVEVLYRIADYAALRWPEFAGAKPLLQAVYEGRPEEAFQRLVREMGIGVPEHDPTYGGNFFPGFDEALAGALSRLLNAVAAGQHVDPKLARDAYEMEFPDLQFQNPTRAEFERRALLLDNLRRLEPGPEFDHTEMIEAWLNLGYTHRAGRAIANEYNASPENDSWRLAHFVFLRSQQRHEEALVVAMDGGPDLRDRDIYQQALFVRLRGSQTQPFARILRQLLDLTRTPPLEGLGSAFTQHLAKALNAGDHEQGRQALREVWRRLFLFRKLSNPPAGGSRSPDQRFQGILTNLLNARLPGTGQDTAAGSVGRTMGAGTPPGAISGMAAGAPPEPRMLFDAVADTPYGAQELEGFLRAMPDEERKGFRPLYEYLAKAEVGSDRLQELSSRLREQAIDDHEFTLWMLLHDRQEAEFVPGELQAFEERLAAMLDPSPYQLLLAARIFAASGAVGQAVEHYKLVMARRIQHNEFAEPRALNESFPWADTHVASLLELIDEVTEKLPREAARDLAEQVLSLARRADDLPGADALFGAFVLVVLGKAYAPQELLEQARRQYPSVLTLPDQLSGVGAAKAVELVRAYARSGDLNRATEILGALLREPAPWIQSTTSRVLSRKAAAMRSLQFSKAVAMRSLQSLCGITVLERAWGSPDRSHAGAREILARMERLFPVQPNDWPEVSDWIGAVTDALLGWLADEQADETEVLELLTALGMRAVRMGEQGQAADLLARTIAAMQARGQPPSPRGVLRLASLAQESGNALPLGMAASALKDERLPWQGEITLVRLFQTSEDRSNMLNLVREYGLDHGLEVLRILHTIAEDSGDTAAYASHLQQRIEREEAAEKTLLKNDNRAKS